VLVNKVLIDKVCISEVHATSLTSQLAWSCQTRISSQYPWPL